jgi:hypothetical protein
MAQVTQDTQARINLILDILEWQWERLPQVEAEIDSWDLLDQLHFIEKWPLEEDRLMHLERYVAAGALTDEQMARYQKLKHIIVQNRPIIRRLQQS